MAEADEIAAETTGQDAGDWNDSVPRWVELLTVLVLTLGTVAAAWSGYQVARWGGVQATATADANTTRLASAQTQTSGGQLAQIDVVLFFRAVNAIAVDDDQLTQFYVDRFRDEFRPVYDTWIALDPENNPEAPPTPFDLPEYEVAELVEADRLDAEAEAFVADSREARERAETYSIALLLFAAALFFAAISSKFSSRRAHLGVLALGCILFVATTAWVASLPKSVAL